MILDLPPAIEQLVIEQGTSQKIAPVWGLFLAILFMNIDFKWLTHSTDNLTCFGSACPS